MAGKRGRVHFGSMASDTSVDVITRTDLLPTSAPLDDLAHNPVNPRENYDDVDELAQSLAESGQLQPITVVTAEVFLAHYPEHAEVIGEASWVVVTGNRRLAAARRLGLPELAITVQDRLGADDRIREATLVENIHRQSLPPLLEAREIEALVKRHGSQNAAARRISMTQGWVSQRLALLKLAPDLQDELRAGGLTIEEARGIATKPVDQQRDALELLRRNSSPAAGDGATDGRRRRRGSSDGDGQSGQRALIRLDDVDHTASDLRARLSADDRKALARLLLEED